MDNAYMVVTSVLFTAIGSVQLARVLGKWHITVNGMTIPSWISVLASIAAFGMAWWTIQQ